MNTKTIESDKLQLALIKRNNYIRQSGGHWEISEYHTDLNALNEEVIKAFSQIHPNSHTGIVNFNKNNRVPLRKYDENKLTAWNNCSFMVPDYDDDLVALIKDYNATPLDMEVLSEKVERIFDMVYELGGVSFRWV